MAGGMVVATVLGSLVIQIIASKPLQDIWGIVNVQQLSLFIIAINVRSIPSNAINFQNFISGLNQRDMYPMEEINKAVFNFSKTDSLKSVSIEGVEVENFEGLGLDGINFIELSGSLIVNFMLIIGFEIITRLIQKVCVMFHKQKWARYVGIKSSVEMDVIQGIQNMFITAYLDIIVCCFISLEGKPLQDKSTRGSDIFAFTFSKMILTALILQPIYMTYRIHQKKFYPHEEGQKYQLFWKDLKTEFPKSLFHVQFMLRRGIFAYFLVFQRDHGGLQLILINTLNMINLCLLIHYQPFIEKRQNQLEILNETNVVIHTAIYFLFKVSDKKQNFIGGFYISTYVICILINVLNLLVYKSFPEVKKGVGKLKIKIQVLKYEIWKYNWFQSRKQDSLNFPSNKYLSRKYRESLKIKAKNDVKRLYEDEIKYQFREIVWLQKHKLDTKFLILAKNQQNCLRAPNEVLSEEVKLGTMNMVPRFFYHNLFIHEEQVAPYDEEKYLGIITKFLKDNNIESEEALSPEQLRALKKLVQKSQNQTLERFLTSINLNRSTSVPPGGNAIQMAIHQVCEGQIEGNRAVRKKIVQFLKSQENLIEHRMFMKWRALPQDDKNEHIESLSQNKTQFEPIDILVAAHVYDIPIIEFSSTNKMAFFDKIYDAKSEEGKKKLPIYLLKKQGTHRFLIIEERQLHQKQPPGFLNDKTKPNSPLIKAFPKQKMPNKVIINSFSKQSSPSNYHQSPPSSTTTPISQQQDQPNQTPFKKDLQPASVISQALKNLNQNPLSNFNNKQKNKEQANDLKSFIEPIQEESLSSSEQNVFGGPQAVELGHQNANAQNGLQDYQFKTIPKQMGTQMSSERSQRSSQSSEPRSQKEEDFGSGQECSFDSDEYFREAFEQLGKELDKMRTQQTHHISVQNSYQWQYYKQRDFYYIRKYKHDFERDEAMDNNEFEKKVQEQNPGVFETLKGIKEGQKQKEKRGQLARPNDQYLIQNPHFITKQNHQVFYENKVALPKIESSVQAGVSDNDSDSAGDIDLQLGVSKAQDEYIQMKLKRRLDKWNS